MSRTIKMFLIFFLSYITTLLLVIDINLEELVYGETSWFMQINQLLMDFNIVDVFMGIFVYFFYYNVYFNGEKFTKKNIIISVISIILSILMVIGKNLQILNAFPNLSNIAMFIESTVIFFGFYFIFYALLKKFISIDISFDNKKTKPKKSKKKTNSRLFSNGIIKQIVSVISKLMHKISNFIKEHPFISSLIIISIMRIPFLFLYYPGNSNGDTLDQLCQFFHRKTSWSINMVNLVDENIYINQHHPVFSTLLLGGLVKLGRMFIDFKFGLFLYVLLQNVVLTIIFSFTIYYMKKVKVPFWIRNITLVIICLSPHFLSYSLLAIKDTSNAIFTLLYVIFLIQIVRNYSSIFNNKINTFCFIITMILVMLFRNNGLITLLLSYPFLFLLYKKNWKKLLIVFLIPIITVLSFNQIMYRCFSFSKGSPKEMLSVPFMQIARLANKKGVDTFSKKDQDIINKVLPLKVIAKKYYPDLSDPVKDKYKNSTTKGDLLNFFKVWFKYLCKYPSVYIESFVASTYQYLYPYETYENLMLGSDSRVSDEFSVSDPNARFLNIKTNLGYIIKILFKLPVLSLFGKVAFFDWFLILSSAWVIYKKNYKYLIPLMALIAVLLVCLASPINGSMRYILPILFSLPAMITIDYLVYK